MTTEADHYLDLFQGLRKATRPHGRDVDLHPRDAVEIAGEARRIMDGNVQDRLADRGQGRLITHVLDRECNIRCYHHHRLLL